MRQPKRNGPPIFAAVFAVLCLLLYLWIALARTEQERQRFARPLQTGDARSLLLKHPGNQLG
jgi:hypothetical protein